MWILIPDSDYNHFLLESSWLSSAEYEAMRYVISVWGFRTAQVKFGLRPVPFFQAAALPLGIFRNQAVAAHWPHPGPGCSSRLLENPTSPNRTNLYFAPGSSWAPFLVSLQIFRKQGLYKRSGKGERERISNQWVPWGLKACFRGEWKGGPEAHNLGSRKAIGLKARAIKVWPREISSGQEQQRKNSKI